MAIFNGTASNNTLTGTAGDDQIFGFEGNDSLFGAAGNDSLDGGTGNDTLAGSSGNDVYFIDSLLDRIQETSITGEFDTVFSLVDNINLSNFTVLQFGNVERLVLLGSALSATGSFNDDLVEGNTANNSLNGGSGSDTLIGGAGNDTLNGAFGNDIADYSGTSGSVAVILNSVSGSATGGAGNDALISIERLIGSNGNDAVTATDSISYTIEGGAGADTLTGGSGNDVLDGGAGNDSLNGGAGSDWALYSGAAALSINLLANTNNTGDTLTSIENLRGGTGNDTFTGNASDNMFQGGAGNDSLDGGTGSDWAVYSGPGALSINLNDGTNTAGDSLTSIENLIGSDGGDTLTGNASANNLQGGAGSDLLDGGTGSDTMVGGTGSDIFFVDSSGDRVTDDFTFGDFDTVHSAVDINLSIVGIVTSGYIERVVLTGSALSATGYFNDERIEGNAGNNTLVGGDGDDTLLGGAGNDSLNGGFDFDTADYTGTAAGITAGITAGNGTATGGAGNDTLTSIERIVGGEGNDLLGINDTVGGSTIYTLEGGSGDDTLTGGAGNDQLNGGQGSDWVLFSGAGAFSANLLTGVVSTGDTLVGIENLRGDAGNDTLTGDAAENRFEGGAGNDLLNGGAGNDWAVYSGAAALSINLATSVNNTGDTLTLIENLRGGSGNDTFIGTSGDNAFEGGAGNDSLDGGLGSDTAVYAGPADVTINLTTASNNNTGDVLLSFENLRSGAGADSLTGDGNANVLEGGAGSDTLDGQNGNDRLVAGEGNDSLLGGAGNDTLDGSAGSDALQGGIGDDFYLVDDAGDFATENASAGTDVVLSRSSTFTLGANLENLALIGVSGDSGTGNAQANIITGNAANNQISGLELNDTLVGDQGDDTLLGGEGNDSLAGDDWSGPSLVPVTSNLVASSNELVSGLGGAAGFGESALARNDDGSSFAIDITSIFGSGGLDYFGNSYTALYVNNNGNITFTSSLSSYTPQTIPQLSTPIIAAFWADVDTRATTPLAPTSGGSSTGSNLVYYDLDTENGIFTATWDDVGYFNNHLDKKNAFQIQLIDRSAGDFDIVFRYEAVNWTTGDFSGGSGGLGGSSARAGYTAGNLVNFFELAQSGIQAQVLALEDTLGNTGRAGVYVFSVRNGAVSSIVGGDDILDGGAGDDTMRGGAGSDSYIVNSAADSIIELANGGLDEVTASVSHVLGTNVEDLILTGTATTGTGNAQNNAIVGTAASNTLSGGAGNDFLDGAEGADSMAGGAGNDIMAVDNAGDVATDDAVGGGIDYVIASVSHTLSANVENLILDDLAAGGLSGAGNALTNAISGGDYNDTLNGAAGNDFLFGGDGDDTYIVDSAGDVTDESNGSGIDTVQLAPNVVAYTLGVGVENMTFTTTSDADGFGSNVANSITGNAGNDLLVGEEGDDTLVGRDGNDTLYGVSGVNELRGGIGNDFYLLDGTSDTIIENEDEGRDEVRSDVSQTLAANVEDLILLFEAVIDGTGNELPNAIFGNVAANSLTGLGGNDTLDGGAEADTMEGGEGNDTYAVDNAGDMLVEFDGGGVDTVLTNASIYTIAEYLENAAITSTASASVTGNSADNAITGNIGNDTLRGGAGNDTLAGGAGGDSLVGGDDGGTIDSADFSTATAGINLVFGAVTALATGGAGNDTLVGIERVIGGSGADSFTLFSGTEQVEGGAGNDTVNTAFSYTLGAGVEVLLLSGGALLAAGNAQNNTITFNQPGALENVLNGGAGNDTMAGGAGNDTYVVDATADLILETAVAGAGSADQVMLSGANFSLLSNGANVEHLTITDATGRSATGNALGNSITGGGGIDTLNGDAGSDTLRGGAGVDVFAGGAGNDTYLIDDTANGALEIVTRIVEGAGTGPGTVDTVISSVSFTGKLAPNVENIELVIGAPGAIVATGNDLSNYLKGNELPNRLFGGIGNDTLEGGGGDDKMYGGLGADRYIIDEGNDEIFETGGGAEDFAVSNRQELDLSERGRQIDNVLMGEGAETVIANEQANRVTGNNEANTIDGGAGSDTLTGGTGNDVYRLDSTGDRVEETATGGRDRVEVNFNFTLVPVLEDLKLIGGANINGTGSDSENLIQGNSANNRLAGMGGNDTLEGSGGNDTLDGGLGDDTLDGGANSDTVSFTNEVLAVTASLLGGTATGAGTDTFIDIENLTGGKGNDALTGDSEDNVLDGSLGVDSLVGGAGNDTYVADNAADRIFEAGGEGDADTVQSTVSFSLAAAGVVGEVENLVLLGTAATGTGNALANALTGNNAANTLDGGDGNDIMTGGLGNDTYVVSNALDSVIEALNAGIDTVISGALLGYTLAANVESLTLSNAAGTSMTGSAGNNTLTGGAGNDTLDGAGGNDSMLGGAGNDYYYVDSQGDVIVDSAGVDSVFASVSYNFSANAAIEIAQAAAGTISIDLTGNAIVNFLIGNDGKNLLSGGAGNDQLTGDDGDDTLDGGAGSDGLVGGAGNDTYAVDAPGDAVSEISGEGDADLVKASINYILGAEVENLTLTGTAASGTGNEANNRIEGNALANSLNGAAGDDTLIGGAGNDSYTVDADGDVVVEVTAATGGVDTIVTSLVSKALQDGIENLVFTAAGSSTTGTGNGANNSMTGAGAHDIFSGGAGNDTLVGNGGDDYLDGGLGNDSLNGGLGQDSYVVNAAGDVIAVDAGGTDTVETTFANAIGNAYTIATRVDLENVTLLGTVANAIGNLGANALTGSAGNNSLSGGAGNDTLSGGEGNDTLEGGAGNDLLQGGGGTGDWASFVNETAAITATVNGNATGAGIDALTGIENLQGGKGNDLLAGDAGDNVLDGSLGADTLTGGDGNDTYVVDNINDAVNEAGTGDADAVRASLNYTLGANVERLILSGILNLNGTGNDGDNVLAGNTGNNSLNGGIGNDTADYSASAGAITLNVTAMTVTGAAGNDTLLSIETVAGGAGSGDWLAYSGAGGLDVDLASSPFTGFENLRGTAGDDTLTGDDAGNMLEGGAGNDLLVGGIGNDWAVFTGTAAITASLLTNLAAGQGNDSLAGIENLMGGAGNDNLTGDGFANILDGGLGNDVLTGGAGNDLYIVNALGDRVHESGTDAMDEVQSLQTIDLSGASGIVATGNLVIENVTLLGTAAINATGNLLNNVLTGNTGVNNLIGAEGHDTLNGGAGADSLRGGAGNDWYSVDNAGDKVDESGDLLGFDTVFSTVTYALSGTAAAVEELRLEGAANINATGNALANYLEGNSGNNSLAGLAEGDELEGKDGNDTLDGGAGDDLMIGGYGNDLFLVDSVNDATEEASSAGGIDTVHAALAAGQAWTLGANFENLTLLGLATAHSNGTGNALDNLLAGNAGNNSLDGGLGNDTLRGGAGNDTYLLDSSLDVVDEAIAGSAGNDTVFVINFDYTLGVNVDNLTFLNGEGYAGTGNELANRLTGGAGNDLLTGAGGNDTLDGGTGDDTLAGGLGNDTHMVDSVNDVVIELAGSGIDTLASETINLDLNAAGFANFENLQLLGIFAGTATGNASANLITGNSSDNTLLGGGGNDTLLGGAGNDTLDGGAGIDSMNGGNGHDRYVVDVAGDAIAVDSLGNDTVVAGAGNSGATIYTIAARADLENVELAGAVLIAIGNANANTLAGNGLNNSLAGAAGHDDLDGGGGNDTLDGGLGNDTLTGAGGNDLYFVDNANDEVVESPGEGNDTVSTSLNGYSLGSNLENLILTGAAVSGTGNVEGNRITAGLGNGVLTGGLGNDTLDGGAGNDILIGGDDDDVFIFDQADGSVQGGAGTDTIKVAALLGTAALPFDFGLLLDPRLEDIEVIDITGTGNNSIKVNIDDVAAISDSAWELIIVGNAGDFIKSDDTWQLLGLEEVGGEFYTSYLGFFNSLPYSLLVHPTMTQAINIESI